MSEMRTLCLYLLGVVSVWLYILIGGLIFHSLEHEQEIKKREESITYKKDFLLNNTCVSEEDLEEYLKQVHLLEKFGISSLSNDSTQSWDLERSLFFAMTIVTTIGYGFVTPTTDLSRGFFMVYAIVGIPLFLLQLAALGTRLNLLLSNLSDRLNLYHRNPGRGRLIITASFHLLALVFIVILPAVYFSQEEGWSYNESIYFITVSLSTIGFGDYGTARREKGFLTRLFGYVWLCLGLIWFSQLITKAQEIFNSCWKTVQEKRKVQPEGNKNEKQRSIPRDSLEKSNCEKMEEEDLETEYM